MCRRLTAFAPTSSCVCTDLRIHVAMHLLVYVWSRGYWHPYTPFPSLTHTRTCTCTSPSCRTSCEELATAWPCSLSILMALICDKRLSNSCPLETGAWALPSLADGGCSVIGSSAAFILGPPSPVRACPRGAESSCLRRPAPAFTRHVTSCSATSSKLPVKPHKYSQPYRAPCTSPAAPPA